MHWQENKTRAMIYSVSGLTSEIKTHLEDKYPFVWIQGEISNLSRPSSGHMYFTLKDSKSQISAVIFKNLGYHLKFALENGLQITGLARLSVYEPRGTYQLIFEHLEPKGAGALQLAFEQLKARLAQEGLFDQRHKKSLPFFPNRISVITSPSGAVIHDIIHVLGRRFPNVILEIVPVKVQGEHAANEIEAALLIVNQRKNSDLIIIARGGGSLEDLAPFNTERLARAVFSSEIPVVSAVGHETDFTICDFVADFRAPTPSAAAEQVVPLKQDLVQRINGLSLMLKNGMNNQMTHKKNILERICKAMVDPKRKVIDLRLLNDDLTQRLIRVIGNKMSHQRSSMAWKKEKLLMVSPQNRISTHKKTLGLWKDSLLSSTRYIMNRKTMDLREHHGRLQALNPLSILDRGYSITRTIPNEEILRASDRVSLGQELEVILSKGRLICSVKGIPDNGKEKF